MRKNAQAFTLIEIAIAVFILLLLLTIAIPSLSGVLADRRLRRSFNELNTFVQIAQERSVTERRPYLIAWAEDHLVLRPESMTKEDEAAPATTLALRKGDAYLLTLPAALIEQPPAEWIFWPSGTCELAVVSYKGVDGTWSARFWSLTARPELSSYVAK
jgi:type II secretory pathway pseudopilin PulG